MSERKTAKELRDSQHRPMTRERMKNLLEIHEQGFTDTRCVSDLCKEVEACWAETERVRQVKEALQELSLGAKSALNLWVPADSVTHAELRHGLELADATEPSEVREV